MKTIFTAAIALALLQPQHLLAQTTIRANEQKFENETMQSPYLKTGGIIKKLLLLFLSNVLWKAILL
ncbi:MAG: hypothetical protein IPO24_19235 [Bacteroidetes bacterium]|nr:hypothetical protein [Bacteroidota bacterium]